MLVLERAFLESPRVYLTSSGRRFNLLTPDCLKMLSWSRFVRSSGSGAMTASGLAWMRVLGFFRSLTAPASGVALRLETEGSPIANHCQRDASIGFHLTWFLCHRTNGWAALQGALPHLLSPP